MNKGGAPLGNNNASKTRRLSTVLKQRLLDREKEIELMDVLLDKALEGDLASIREVIDRTDGKAQQSIEQTINDKTTRSSEERKARIKELEEKLNK